MRAFSAPKVTFADVKNQRESLMLLARQTQRSTTNYEIAVASRAITNDCASRDDECELQAIFDAVKFGTDKVDWLRGGVKYTIENRLFDQFFAPIRTIQMCKRGACRVDCDDHAALICALCASIGFKVGLYAWGPEDADDYEHVLAVAGMPKVNPTEWVAMDTTVEDAQLGWKPPPGKFLLMKIN